jgi:hypothetical protein
LRYHLDIEKGYLGNNAGDNDSGLSGNVLCQQGCLVADAALFTIRMGAVWMYWQ